MTLDMQTYLRLVALLAAPDEPAMAGLRGSHVTCPGDPKRRATVLLPLLTRWAVTRYVEQDPAPWMAPARTESDIARRLLRFRRTA